MYPTGWSKGGLFVCYDFCSGPLMINANFYCKPPNNFSALQKNGTAEGVLKVVTGMREVAHVGQILSFNGKVKLDFWKGRCNDLRCVSFGQGGVPSGQKTVATANAI